MYRTASKKAERNGKLEDPRKYSPAEEGKKLEIPKVHGGKERRPERGWD